MGSLSSKHQSTGESRQIIPPKGNREIARNTALNLINRAILVPLGILAIPSILHGMGIERFGLFSLTWTLLSYFAILDLGLGQATTKFMATGLDVDKTYSLSSIFWTASFIMVGLGVVFGTITMLLSPWLVNRILTPPENLIPESIRMFTLLAVSVPFILFNNSLRGALEAMQRFDLVNAVRTPYSAAIYLSPLLGYKIGWQVDKLSVLLLLIVIVTFLVYFILCVKVVPHIFQDVKIHTALVRALLSYSKWVALSNFVAPMLVYLDRFLISAILSVAVLPHYTAPYEGLTRLWMIPMSITAALFPTLSRVGSNDNESRDASWLITSGLKFILLTLGPITVFITMFPKEILTVWMGTEFANASSVVTQILALGILVNSLGRLPATMFLGKGYPDIPAKLHLIELPFYIILTLICLNLWGINGAAFTWTIRVGVDTLLLFIIAKKHKDIRLNVINTHSIIAVISLAGMILFGILIRNVIHGPGWFYQALFFLVMMVVYTWIGWFKILDKKEQAYLSKFLMKLNPKKITS